MLPGGPPVGADGTKMLTEHQTVLERDGAGSRRRRLLAEQGRPPFAERARRATLLVVGALLCGGLVAAYPWYGSVTLLLAVWLLRSGSLAASAAGAPAPGARSASGTTAPQLLVRAPWELLRSLAGTVMLQLWSAGLAVAAALLCYAFVAGETVTLFVCGTVFAAAVWTGPGGSRVRSPLSRVVNPVARRWKPWLAVTFVLLVLATGLGGLAESRGTSWSPGERPSAERTDHRTRDLRLVAGWNRDDHRLIARSSFP